MVLQVTKTRCLMSWRHVVDEHPIRKYQSIGSNFTIVDYICWLNCQPFSIIEEEFSKNASKLFTECLSTWKMLAIFSECPTEIGKSPFAWWEKLTKMRANEEAHLFPTIKNIRKNLNYWVVSSSVEKCRIDIFWYFGESSWDLLQRLCCQNWHSKEFEIWSPVS
jgi:hypothetical protein